MPYLHCPHCRLTLYKPRAAAGRGERCPRCGTQLTRRPKRLFASAPVHREPESARPVPGPPPHAAR